jgi:hypothetical protein
MVGNNQLGKSGKINPEKAVGRSFVGSVATILEKD